MKKIAFILLLLHINIYLSDNLICCLNSCEYTSECLECFCCCVDICETCCNKPQYNKANCKKVCKTCQCCPKTNNEIDCRNVCCIGCILDCCTRCDECSDSCCYVKCSCCDSSGINPCTCTTSYLCCKACCNKIPSCCTNCCDCCNNSKCGRRINKAWKALMACCCCLEDDEVTPTIAPNNNFVRPTTTSNNNLSANTQDNSAHTEVNHQYPDASVVSQSKNTTTSTSHPTPSNNS